MILNAKESFRIIMQSCMPNYHSDVAILRWSTFIVRYTIKRVAHECVIVYRTALIVYGPLDASKCSERYTPIGPLMLRCCNRYASESGCSICNDV